MHNFKKAIQTTVLFILIFCLMSLGIMELYFSGEDHYYQDRSERAALAGTLDFLVVGASHAERGFNTAILDEELGVNSYNLSGPDLTMWGRYDILKKELARNPVKTVVLELSIDSLLSRGLSSEVEGDLYYMGRIDTLPQRAAYFREHFPVDEYVPSYQFFMSYGVESIKRILQRKYMWRYNWPYRYKGYKMYEGGGANDVSFNYKKKYHTYHVDTQIIEEKDEYLHRIVDLCREYDVELILVDVPVSRHQVCHKDGYDEIHEYYKAFAEREQLAFYDFNLLKNRDELFSDEKSFRDMDHLWNEGADLFTREFSSVLKQATAGEDVSGLFFESYEAYDRTQDYYPEKG